MLARATRYQSLGIRTRGILFQVSSSISKMASTSTGDTEHRYGALFASQAAEYSKYRPTYPKALYNEILRYADMHGTGAHSAAADIATGNGQAAVDIASHYDAVVGVDVSPQQVAQAPPAKNMQFALGSAEATSLPSEHFDLVTVAQAMHWFDLPKFYGEMHRILKPKGTLAIWGYLMGAVEGSGNPDGDAKAHAAKTKLWSGTLGSCWDERRGLLDNEYVDMDPPESLFTAIERHKLYMEKEWTLAQLAGYCTTWSAYATYCKKHTVIRGSAEDPATQFLDDLLAAYNTTDVNHKTMLRFPIVLLTATRKP